MWSNQRVCKTQCTEIGNGICSDFKSWKLSKLLLLKDEIFLNWEVSEIRNCQGVFVQHHKIKVDYFGILPVANPGVSQPYLPGLVHSFLGVTLHLVAGVVCDLCDRLFEDRGCLSHRQGSVQIRLALFQTRRKGKTHKNSFNLLKCYYRQKEVQQGTVPGLEILANLKLYKLGC